MPYILMPCAVFTHFDNWNFYSLKIILRYSIVVDDSKVDNFWIGESHNQMPEFAKFLILGYCMSAYTN